MTAPNYQAPGGSAIAVTTKFIPLAFILYFFKPKVAINGQELPQQGWGRQVIPVQPGNYRVDVHTPYFLPPKLGPAQLDVAVAPGQTVELEYKAPAFAFINGSLGAPPQKYNGLFIYWIILGVFALLIICCCASAIFNN
ncbi:MAG TPA: hypothetical protein VHA75_04020 [Rugosimonospora sp.]|nr:hypothetical protein [Rugosimonospora sp.]